MSRGRGNARRRRCIRSNIGQSSYNFERSCKASLTAGKNRLPDAEISYYDIVNVPKRHAPSKAQRNRAKSHLAKPSNTISAARGLAAPYLPSQGRAEDIAAANPKENTTAMMIVVWNRAGVRGITTIPTVIRNDGAKREIRKTSFFPSSNPVYRTAGPIAAT